MIFRQLYDHASSTYSYLIASRQGGEALLVDPVLEHADRYVQLTHELDLRSYSDLAWWNHAPTRV